MKLNWGTSIVIAFGLFMSFVLFFVIKATTNDSYKHELVKKEYYKDEINHQQSIDKEENLKSLSQAISIQKDNSTITFEFPVELNNQNTQGSIYFYRASNAKLDFTIPLQIEENQQVINRDLLLDGKWKVNINFKMDDTDYLFIEELTL